MNIVVVGPGAIGSLWACKLHQAGHNIALWGTQSAQQWELSLDDQTTIEFAYNQTQTLIDADLILITVKAGQVSKALKPILQHISKDAILLFMHNGMGAIDEIKSQISAYPVIIATTTHGALKPDSHHVKHTGLGNTQMGAVNAIGEQCSFVVDVFNHAMPTVEWNPNIAQALWKKLAINCAINPLTAIHQCLNGALAEAKYRSTLDCIIEEVVAVMDAENIPVNQIQLTQTIDKVISATSTNKSSTYQDIFYHRQTEIDFITGYVIRKAQQHGISVPTNTELYHKIKILELNGKHHD